MRTFSRLVLLFFCVFIYPFWIILASISISGINNIWIKQELQTVNIYPLLVEKLNTTIDTAIQSNENIRDLTAIAPIVKKEITPDLVKGKLEKLIDDTYDWLTQKTVQPPSVSFVELKDVLIAQNPQLARQFNLTASTDTAKPIPVDPEYDYGVPHLSVASVVDQALNNKLIFPVGKNFSFLKNIYDAVKLSLLIMTITLIAGILLIFIISPTAKSGWRWIWITTSILIFWNIVPFILLLSPTLIVSFITTRIDAGFATFLPVVLKPFLSKIVFNEVIITGILFAVSFVSLIISLIVQENKKG